MANAVTTLLNYGLDRAFSNLFEVEVIPRNIYGFFQNCKYIAERITFGNVQISTDFNTAYQGHTLKAIEKIKTVTITFRESSQLSVLSTLKGWMNYIYDFETNTFQSYGENESPYGTITATLDGPSAGIKIRMEEVIPTSIGYPTLTWEDGNPIKLDCTFSCNTVKVITSVSLDHTVSPPREVENYV
jgi:hypothetical protein